MLAVLCVLILVLKPNGMLIHATPKLVNDLRFFLDPVPGTLLQLVGGLALGAAAAALHLTQRVARRAAGVGRPGGAAVRDHEHVRDPDPAQPAAAVALDLHLQARRPDDPGRGAALRSHRGHRRRLDAAREAGARHLRGAAEHRAADHQDHRLRAHRRPGHDPAADPGRLPLGRHHQRRSLRPAGTGPQHRGRVRRSAGPGLRGVLRAGHLLHRGAHLARVARVPPGAQLLARGAHRDGDRRPDRHHHRRPGAAAARRLPGHRDPGLRGDRPHHLPVGLDDPLRRRRAGDPADPGARAVRDQVPRPDVDLLPDPGRLHPGRPRGLELPAFDGWAAHGPRCARTRRSRRRPASTPPSTS